MKRRLLMLTLMTLVATTVLLIVGCPGEEQKTYVGTWENIAAEPYYGSTRILMTVTESTFQTEVSDDPGTGWEPIWGMKGTMTASADTFAVTLTHVSNASEGYPGWYDETFWDYDYHYDLWDIYYNYAGGATFDFTYDLSADGNTLYVIISGHGVVPFARV